MALRCAGRPNLAAHTDIFLSYASSEQKKSHAVAQSLRGCGYTVWLDTDSFEDTGPGRGAPTGTCIAISRAAVVVACVSASYATQPSCQSQAEFASDAGKPIFWVNVGAPGWHPKAYDHSSEAQISGYAWLDMLVRRALLADCRSDTAAAGASGMAVLLGQLRGTGLRKSGSAVPGGGGGWSACTCAACVPGSADAEPTAAAAPAPPPPLTADSDPAALKAAMCMHYSRVDPTVVVEALRRRMGDKSFVRAVADGCSGYLQSSDLGERACKQGLVPVLVQTMRLHGAAGDSDTVLTCLDLLRELSKFPGKVVLDATALGLAAEDLDAFVALLKARCVAPANDRFAVVAGDLLVELARVAANLEVLVRQGVPQAMMAASWDKAASPRFQAATCSVVAALARADAGHSALLGREGAADLAASVFRVNLALQAACERPPRLLAAHDAFTATQESCKAAIALAADPDNRRRILASGLLAELIMAAEAVNTLPLPEVCVQALQRLGIPADTVLRRAAEKVTRKMLSNSPRAHVVAAACAVVASSFGKPSPGTVTTVSHSRDAIKVVVSYGINNPTQAEVCAVMERFAADAAVAELGLRALRVVGGDASALAETVVASLRRHGGNERVVEAACFALGGCSAAVRIRAREVVEAVERHQACAAVVVAASDAVFNLVGAAAATESDKSVVMAAGAVEALTRAYRRHEADAAVAAHLRRPLKALGEDPAALCVIQ